MRNRPEITFHGVSRSPWVEDYIGERLQRLERLADDIVSCHVTLERAQSPHHKGNLYRVTVDVRLPPEKELVAGKERSIQDMRLELRALIRAAFEAVERQLRKAIERRRHDVKTHEEQPRGLVAKVYPDEGYGFIRTLEDDRELYFHRNSVLHGDFDRLTIGTEVRFSAEQGESGPQASSVQIVAKPGSRTSESR